VTNAIPDAFDLRARLRREVGEPAVRNMANSFGDCLDRIRRGAPHNRIATERRKGHSRCNIAQDLDLGEAIPDRDLRSFAITGPEWRLARCCPSSKGEVRPAS
jgi:hypothetical protein